MLNGIWAFLVLAGLIVAGLLGKLSGTGGVIELAMKSAETAVMVIALPLAGMMMFWLGVLRLIDKAGVLAMLARALSPILRRLFPDVPADHPALGAIIMNLSANVLGLGNSATPLGLKAMGHLQELNPAKKTPTNAMCLFLALNTAGFSLLPSTSIAYLSAAGVAGPYRVILPTILATTCSTLVAIIVAKSLQRLPTFAVSPADQTEVETPTDEAKAEPAASRTSTGGKVLLAVLAAAFIGIACLQLGPPAWRSGLLESTGISDLMAKAAASSAAATKAIQPATTADTSYLKQWFNGLSTLALPLILFIAVGVAFARGVKVYEEFVEGAKEGFGTATRIMPFLVAMLAALALFKGSGMLLLIGHLLSPLLNLIGFPVDLLPLGLMRPLSGSGASGILNEILTNPNSAEWLKFSAATLYGSSETTFYVVTVYFGSVGIRKVRHALIAGLMADTVGMLMAVVLGRLFFA
jgi:spore maturation protein SpmA